MKRLRLITKNMSHKTKSRIRATITTVCVLIIVICFVALVVGLSLGLKDDDSCQSGWSKCSGTCRDLQNDENNCGNCGNVCPTGSICISGSCDFCALNCSDDGNLCTMEPCNETTGCTPVDCDNDGDFCTVAPCDPDTGCALLNCTTDDNVCTTFPCNPATGCTVIDCNIDGDPCTEEPCNPLTGCAYVCPLLLLAPPSMNFSASYPNATTPRAIAGSNLVLTSSPNMASVTITALPNIVGSNIQATISLPSGLSENYNAGSGVYTLSGTATAGTYQTVLRSVRYTAPSGGTTISFTYQATNDKPLSLVQNPVATITVA